VEIGTAASFLVTLSPLQIIMAISAMYMSLYYTLQP